MARRPGRAGPDRSRPRHSHRRLLRRDGACPQGRGRRLHHAPAGGGDSLYRRLTDYGAWPLDARRGKDAGPEGRQCPAPALGHRGCGAAAHPAGFPRLAVGVVLQHQSGGGGEAGRFPEALHSGESLRVPGELGGAGHHRLQHPAGRRADPGEKQAGRAGAPVRHRGGLDGGDRICRQARALRGVRPCRQRRRHPGPRGDRSPPGLRRGLHDDGHRPELLGAASPDFHPDAVAVSRSAARHARGAHHRVCRRQCADRAAAPCRGVQETDGRGAGAQRRR